MKHRPKHKEPECLVHHAWGRDKREDAPCICGLRYLEEQQIDAMRKYIRKERGLLTHPYGGGKV